MKLYGDFHIHSALSPCAMEEMSPNNIVNMAVLKGLDFIAVTDHNATANLAAIKTCADKNNLLLVPGMELETREEVHLLCLFDSLLKAMEFGEIVYQRLPNIQNREKIFGKQLIFDTEDEVVKEEQRLLLNAVDISIEEAFRLVADLGGVTIPAHIDRASNSILSNLGGIPEDINFKNLEFSRFYTDKDSPRISRAIPDIARYRHIFSSDAHELSMIFEREFYVEVHDRSVSEIIKALQL